MAASCNGAGATLSLQTCDPFDRLQRFPHDFTRIRDTPYPFGFMRDITVIPEDNGANHRGYLFPGLFLKLIGSRDGSVSVGAEIRNDQQQRPAAVIMCLVGPVLVCFAYWWSRRRKASHGNAFCRSVYAYLFLVGAGNLTRCIFQLVVATTSGDGRSKKLPCGCDPKQAYEQSRHSAFGGVR